MKKMMLAAAIVCAAVVSQGASITWSTANVTFDGEGSTLFDSTWELTPIASGNAYLFTGLTAEDYASLTTSAGIWNAFNGSDKLTIGDNEYTVSQTQSIKDGAAEWNATTVADNSDNYAAVIITTTQGDKNYYSASTLEALGVPVGGADMTAGLAWKDGDVYGDAPVYTTWTAVGSSPTPEPTSGLLLLIGMAGLALRRRRA